MSGRWEAGGGPLRKIWDPGPHSSGPGAPRQASSPGRLQARACGPCPPAGTAKACAITARRRAALLPPPSPLSCAPPSPHTGVFPRTCVKAACCALQCGQICGRGGAWAGAAAPVARTSCTHCPGAQAVSEDSSGNAAAARASYTRAVDALRRAYPLEPDGAKRGAIGQHISLYLDRAETLSRTAAPRPDVGAGTPDASTREFALANDGERAFKRALAKDEAGQPDVALYVCGSP